jgi:aspartyl-tRNA(Asn)/glutamyl-tRNA(Gln) amidotransferase subunit C
MPLSHDEVRKVARLAHLQLDESEVDALAGELSGIVDHVARLQTLDTTDVEPTAQVVSMGNVMREDEIRPSWTPERVLANAPRRQHGFFVVQAILD